jgi:peptide chain release factor 1
MVSTAQCRSRENSFEEAKTAILEKLNGKASAEHREEVASVKKDQVGSGMRGDKVRTIQFQNDVVTDHRNGKKMNATKFMKGFMDSLWD